MRVGLGLFADRWNVSVQEESENIMYNLTKTMIDGLSVEDRRGVVKTGKSHSLNQLWDSAKIMNQIKGI